jgi:DNA-directed RNA polymerase subunit alpha
MKWKNLQMPKRVEVDDSVTNERYGRFLIEPLERGFGQTLGNSLRRVLLSSLQGCAVTAVRFNGALHEFSSLTGVVEDATEIVLRLKQIRLKHHGDGTKIGRFKRKGTGIITAGDLEIDSAIEVLNPDLQIATLNDEADMDIEVEVGTGKGYVSSDNQPPVDRPIGVIPVDSLFAPVTKVNYEVESARIGQRIDYDKLTLDIWTDGSILPGDSLGMAAKILRDHFSLFIHFQEPIEEEVEEEVDEEFNKIKALLEKTVDELELSVRSANCLRAARIRTLGQLVLKSEAEMLKYRNFGRKSLKEIADILSGMGLHFGMDVAKYLGPDALLDTEPPDDEDEFLGEGEDLEVSEEEEDEDEPEEIGTVESDQEEN